MKWPKAHGSFSDVALDRYIEQVRAEWKNVGLAVAVVAGRSVIYSQGFGLRQFDHAARVTADTLFQIGSTTKAFTTAALGMLVEEGKIHWDDAVIDYLPGFQLQDSWVTRNLTIRDAVTHRSGTSDRSARNFYPFLGIKNSDETIAQARHLVAEAPFRDSYRYSNIMYAVAGKVTEAASGLAWQEWVRRRLLQPLRMNRSGMSPYEFWDARHVAPAIFGSAPAGRPSLDCARDENVAMPHGWDENGAIAVMPWQSYDNAAAAGSIVSSAADMANWLILNLDEGRFENQQLLTEQTLRELHATQNLRIDANQFPFLETGESYAMGWRRSRYCGHTHLAHGGGIIGFPAYVAMLPDRKLAVVVLSNGSQEAREKVGVHKAAPSKSIAFWIFDRLLEAPVRDWSKDFLGCARQAHQEAGQMEERLERSRLRRAPPSLTEQQYTGEYEDIEGRSGRVHVVLKDGQLKLCFAGEGAYSADLEHWHGEIFRLRTHPGVADVLGPQFASFVIDALGEVVAVSAFGATLRRAIS